MGRFKLTQKARSDLKAIATYSQKQWGREQRLDYIKQFDATFHRLASSPDLGSSCDFIRAGYRKFPCSSHIIFYRIAPGDEVEIVRVLHKRMDVNLQFSV